jgi:hypothetical protein
MSTFGPFYPARLQESINHAERLVDMLSVHQECAHDGEIWLNGRADEIQCFVLAVAEDWRAGRVGEQAAKRSIDDYLEDLHLSIALYFGQDVPSCCRAVAARTALPARAEARTLVLSVMKSRGPDRGDGADATRA